MDWDKTKKGFDKWENATAKVLETVMKSPIVLKPSGALLTTLMRTKAATDRAAASFWGAMGLPTKRDQERTLYALHKLESRLNDLEEKLDGAASSSDARVRTKLREG